MKHRVLLVSDMHYTTNETAQELKKRFPMAKASVASGLAFGYTQEEKLAKINEAVTAEHTASPLDMILILGDLSIDDYDYRKLPENYCEKFRDTCMANFPCPSFALAGNHDSYPDDIWRKMFGYGRQFAVELGNCVFLMLDTFRTLPATGASGAGYTPADLTFVREALSHYRGRQIFLCAHYFANKEADGELRELVRENDDVIGLFCGHTHLDKITDFGGKPLVDIGGYAYNGIEKDGHWDFNVFDPAWGWGYEILEWDENSFHLYHVKPPRHYEGTNGSFDLPLTVSGELTLKRKE